MSNQDPVSYFTRALAICEAQMSGEHPLTLQIFGNYVTFLSELYTYGDVEALLQLMEDADGSAE